MQYSVINLLTSAGPGLGSTPLDFNSAPLYEMLPMYSFKLTFWYGFITLFITSSSNNDSVVLSGVKSLSFFFFPFLLPFFPFFLFLLIFPFLPLSLSTALKNQNSFGLTVELNNNYCFQKIQLFSHQIVHLSSYLHLHLYFLLVFYDQLINTLSRIVRFIPIGPGS